MKKRTKSAFNLRLETLDDTIEINDFKCRKKPGSRALEFFLKQHALDNLHTQLSITYVGMTEDNRVVGFFSLACGSINSDNVERHQKRSLIVRIRYPAIYIGRFAVDDRYQNRGVGKWLMTQVFAKSIHISTHIGCRFIMVQSKPTSASFYEEKFGFIRAQNLKNGNILLYKNILPIISDHLVQSTEKKAVTKIS